MSWDLSKGSIPYIIITSTEVVSGNQDNIKTCLALYLLIYRKPL